MFLVKNGSASVVIMFISSKGPPWFFSSCSFQTVKQYVFDFTVWLHSAHVSLATWKQQQQQQMAAIVLPFLCCGAEQTGRSLYLHPSCSVEQKAVPFSPHPW